MIRRVDFTTDYRNEKAARERAIYDEFQQLMDEHPGASKGEVSKFLMEKYGIHSVSTIWLIRKRYSEKDKRNGSDAR